MIQNNSKDFVLRQPQPDELCGLTQLCLRAKAVWGYDDAFLAACLPAFDFADGLQADWLRVAVKGDQIVGLVQLTYAARTAYLDKLFVEPHAMGTGVGGFLFTTAVQQARGLGTFQTLTIVSDPGAAPFYERIGAALTGQFEPSEAIPGRSLPVLSLRLDPPDPRS